MRMNSLIAPDAAWLAHICDPVVMFGRSGVVEWSNPAFQAIFRHAISSSRPPWGRVSPPAFVEGARRFEASTPNGRLLEWSQTLLPDGRSVAVGRDITERVAAAAEVGRAKTLLFATLTHELRTPLNGVLGMANLLWDEALDPAQRDHVQVIRQSGEHLLDLITEILDYSRLETGRITLENAPFSPEDLVQSVVELMAPRAHEKGLDIVAVVGEDVPASVRGDDGRLRQILFNLAGNAVKFTEVGGVTVSVRRTSAGHLRFSVQDTGPGIPAAKQTQIFEEFSQADASISRRYGGAGLGLAIVRRLATAMGGTVALESRPGAGALFAVDMPFPEAGQRQPAGEAPLRGLRVGVLASSAILRAGAVQMVQALGAVGVGLADLGAQGAGFDRLLVDDGLLRVETDAAIRAWTQAVAPALVLLRPEQRADIERYRCLGVERYLIKPLRRRSVLEQLLGEKVRSGAAAADEPVTDDRVAPARLEGLRVLLAEDNPVNALLARTVLNRAGATVDVATDGEEAVAAFAAAGTPYDLVILDLRMPRLDGLGAARRLRATGTKVAIIALTADSNPEDRAAAMAAGMDDFLTKPISPRDLAMVAGRYVRAASCA